MVFYKNDFFDLISDSGKLYITVYKKGYNIKSFNKILIDYPIIHLTYFKALMESLKEGNAKKIQIGYVRSRIEIIISPDETKAEMIINISAEEMDKRKIEISTEIIEAINTHNITEGLDNSLFTKPLKVHKKILIAQTHASTHGEDAKISYYKPINKDSGINLDITNRGKVGYVRKGDWLGEKIPPTSGISGRTVTGKLIPTNNGADINLKYDKETVEKRIENNKITLRSLIDGFVEFENGVIKVIAK